MITIDFETRSECDLLKAGAWAYSQHPSTEVLCMAYAVDDGPVKLWTPEDVPPVELMGDDVECEAHNAQFEQAIWQNVLGWGPVEWSCSAAKAAAHSVPRSLDKAGEALGLSIQKDQEGKRVMMKMCKPRKPTKLNKNKWHESPEDFEKLYAYCMDDVRAERALSNALRDLNETETKVWKLDQKINERGIRVDTEAIKKAIHFSDIVTREVNQQMADITGGEVKKVTEAGKLANWVNSRGLAMHSVTKDEVADALAYRPMAADVREALKLRQKASKTSVAKYKAMAKAIGEDGRIRGLLMYHGAGTGRWTGKLVQPQNLPRNNYTGDLEQYFTLLKTASDSAFNLCVPDVMGTISKLIRPCFIASEGMNFYGGDYASIEARTLLWLAGDEDALDVFRRGDNIYKALSGEIYGMAPEDAQAMPKSDDRYMLGKQGILGLGYGMGHPKFMDTCLGYGIEVDIEMAEKVKNTYRETYSKVVSFWYDQERTAIDAVRSGEYRTCGKIGWGIYGDFLYCKLPSKRCIAYHKPKIELTETPWGQTKETLTYMGTNSVTRKYERERTYGGKIAENITQGVARDLMAEAMLRLDEAGYEIVLTVHDEVVAEKEDGSVREFEGIMTHIPEWGEGIPVDVEGWTGQRYVK